MKLSAEVEICNLLTASVNTKPKKKSSRAILTLGKKSIKDVHGYLMICTNSNKSGVTYKIHQNIEKIFSKFTSEGKCTLRTREPPHDILISKADPIQLKSFINAVHACLSGTQPEDQTPMRILTPASSKEISAMKTKLVIKQRGNYPVTTTFPPSLEQLVVNDISLKAVDSRMLKLKHLRLLDLSNNNIKTLPDVWESMESLRELDLSSNKLERIPLAFFSGRLSRQLVTLDLSKNMISHLPASICNFKQLSVLRLGSNRLAKIPHDLPKLTRLNHLVLADNNLRHLPSEMTTGGMRLETVDVSGNPASDPFLTLATLDLGGLERVPSLYELAAGAVRDNQVPYTEFTLSSVVRFYLELIGRKCCVCRRHCFERRGVLKVPLSLHPMASTTSGASRALCEFVVCSKHCLEQQMYLQLLMN